MFELDFISLDVIFLLISFFLVFSPVVSSICLNYLFLDYVMVLGRCRLFHYSIDLLVLSLHPKLLVQQNLRIL